MVGGRTDIGEADSNAQATHMDLFPTYRGVNVNPTGLKGSKTDLSAAERVMRVVYRIADMTSTTVCVIFRGSDIVTTSVSKADSPVKTLHTSVSIPHTGVDAAVDAMSSLLEPLIMAILGVLVGGLVIAMYLPIFKLGAVV